jgi:hypothetical protein
MLELFGGLGEFLADFVEFSCREEEVVFDVLGQLALSVQFLLQFGEFVRGSEA